MRKVKLLKAYNGHNAGEIIEVSNNVAFGLIDNKIGEYPEVKDFFKKPKFITEVKTTTFNEPPSARYIKRKMKK